VGSQRGSSVGLAVSFFLLAGCGGGGVTGAGTGGGSATGGRSETGGATATGGRNGTGGATATGGRSGTGGRIGSGGTGTATGGTGTGTGGAGTPGSGGAGGAGGVILAGSGCPLFTADDAWNADVSAKAVDAAATTRLMALVGNVQIHPDFGAGFGIPINVVPETQTALPITFDAYPEESDPGPYPFPAMSVARVEGTTDPTDCDGDCHLLAVQRGTCMLYEGYTCRWVSGGWRCGNGAKWDLKRKSYGQRMSGWTSADAAGLPIYAGLARREEVLAGEITHAIRFTVKCTAPMYIAPATHQAVPGGCAGNTNAPPMGLRVRLKASFDVSSYNATAQVFLRAFKKYGMILADNGSNFYFQSEDSPAWDDDEINDLKRVPANAFEVVGP
jgi:hypothetical protein